jgi:hypothetical protein
MKIANPIKKKDEGVRFTDYSGGGEKDIVEAQPIPGSSDDKDLTGRRRLSFVSRQYDIDGDGQLDDAELASESAKACVV